MTNGIRRTSLGLALLGGLAVLAAACGDDEVVPTPTSTSTGSGAAGGTGGGGNGGTGGGNGGGGAGGGNGGNGGAGGGGAGFPAPVVAGTPETDALADAPARCGQQEHAWRKDLELGQITAHESAGSYPKALLEALLGSTLANLPIELQYDVATHLVTYVTQDRGQEVEATTLIAWPANVPAGTEPLPTLLLLHGTSGFTDGCGPTAEASEGAIAAALASAGFVVVAPDYIGLKSTPPPTGFLHPYLVGQATAIASLDAVRALGHLPAEIVVGGGQPSPRVAILGGSQGGHAALWVDRLAPYYARELTLVGVAATVPPADLLGEGDLALTTLRPSTGNMVAFFGASAGWYGAEGSLAEVFLPPLDLDVPAALGASCDPGDIVQGATALDDIFQPEILAAAANDTLTGLDPWGCMALENGLTSTSVARIPQQDASYGILFVTGEADALVDTPTERAAYQTLCGAGMPLQYLECTAASHTEATTWALPEILTFLKARLAGEAFAPSCDVGAAISCAGTPPP